MASQLSGVRPSTTCSRKAITQGTPTAQPEPLRHMLFGTAPAVQATIVQLHKLGYAEPNDWSQPMPTGRPNEVMAILTKRISVG